MRVIQILFVITMEIGITKQYDNIVGRWDDLIDEKRLDDMASQLADDYCKAKNCGHVLPNDLEIAHDSVLIGLKRKYLVYVDYGK